MRNLEDSASITHATPCVSWFDDLFARVHVGAQAQLIEYSSPTADVGATPLRPNTGFATVAKFPHAAH
jgi:hypothetical protein